MLLIPEKLVPELLSVTDALAAVERTFAAYDRDAAQPYPVVRETIGHKAAVFGIKSGFDRSAMVLGLKAGGYWPQNAAAGRTNHQSTILLFDPETGMPAALVGANYLTGVRTGAASAIATRHLAREGASTLSIIGAGVQSRYQLHATLAVRNVKTVVAWDPLAANLEMLGRDVAALGLGFTAAASAEEAVRRADILITVTPSNAAIVQKEWVRPGTHINAMGADTAGKQELTPELVAASSVCVDAVEQAITIGECQHAFRLGLVGRSDLTRTLGGLASGRQRGRSHDDEITLFDGTGIALQDLAAAGAVVARARERGLGLEVEL